MKQTENNKNPGLTSDRDRYIVEICGKAVVTRCPQDLERHRIKFGKCFHQGSLYPGQLLPSEHVTLISWDIVQLLWPKAACHETWHISLLPKVQCRTIYSRTSMA